MRNVAPINDLQPIWLGMLDGVFGVYNKLAIMVTPLPIPQLIEEWLKWAKWQADPNRSRADGGEFIGSDEFNWITTEHPEHAWQGILAALNDRRTDAYINILAAGPLEDLLSQHGEAFIDRVEAQAAADPRFASLLGGVWQLQMSEDIWRRVQAVWDRRGWDGIPEKVG